MDPAAFRRLCVETATKATPHQTSPPAAFRRLCVETSAVYWIRKYIIQPPLGGCVLKHDKGQENQMELIQPPLGGCVLKPRIHETEIFVMFQPPLGGCVLKRCCLRRELTNGDLCKKALPSTAETQTQVFGCFHVKYPLFSPRTPHNQASGPPFRRQQAHLAC